MNNGSSDRLDRMESVLGQVIDLQARQQEQLGQHLDLIGQQQQLFGQQQGQIQILLDASKQHESRIALMEAMITRLDSIIERMVYREGRGDGDKPQA